MELTTREIENLKDIFYKDKYVDENVIKKVIDLFNKNEIIDNTITCKINYNSSTLAETSDDNEMYFNPLKLELKLLDTIEDRKTPRLFNAMYLSVLLHEITHAEQNMYAKNRSNEYELINDIYYTYNNFFYDSILLKIRYLIHGHSFAFERHANLSAYNGVMDVFDSEEEQFAAINYLYYLLESYKVKNGIVISPVNKTLDYLGISASFDYEGLPFYERVLHGFDIEYKDLIRLCECANNCETDVEAVKSVKRLMRKM